MNDTNEKNGLPRSERDATPSPNKYMLPYLIGPDRTRVWKERSPDVIMAGKLNYLVTDQSPGPAKYILPDIIGQDARNIYANRPPIYSM